MPNRSIRDDMQAAGYAPPPNRVYGAPMGPAQRVPGVKRPRVGPGTPQQARAAIEQDRLGSLAESAAPRMPPARIAPAPQANVLAPHLEGRSTSTGPTRSLALGDAAGKLLERPGLINQAVDEASR